MAYWSNRPRHPSISGPVPPDELSQHVNAFLVYSTAGLLDPTNVADVPAWKAAGYSTRTGFVFAAARGFLAGGALLYIFDPLDLRSGWDADVPAPFALDTYPSDFMLPGNQNVWF